MIPTRVLACVLLAVAGTASAQTSSSFDAADAVSPTSIVEGPGVKIGEGSVLHPVLGLETGVVSNVFYEDTDVNAAGVLRLLAQVGTGSLPKARLMAPAMIPTEPEQEEGGTVTNRGEVEYRADLRLSYDLLLSTNNRVTETGGLGVGASLRVLARPGQTWQFGASDDFQRLIRAANFETDANTNRDINRLSLRVLLQPRTSAFGGVLHYDNTLDVFERDEQGFANRMQHLFGLRPHWQWLPATRIFASFTQGIYTGLGSSSMKVTSYPLTAVAGIQTLFSLRTTLSLHVGYTNGFYSSGPSYSGVTLGANFGYRYSPLGRISLLYDLMYEDSVNANFYRDHVLRLWLQQLFVPFVLTIQPELHFRQYQGVTAVAGPPTRDDVIIALTTGMHYNFRNWIAATLNYRFASVQTNYRYMTDGLVDDPSYVRHELLLGVRAAL